MHYRSTGVQDAKRALLDEDFTCSFLWVWPTTIAASKLTAFIHTSSASSSLSANVAAHLFHCGCMRMQQQRSFLACSPLVQASAFKRNALAIMVDSHGSCDVNCC